MVSNLTMGFNIIPMSIFTMVPDLTMRVYIIPMSNFTVITNLTMCCCHICCHFWVLNFT